MAFTPKTWQDAPATTTPVSAAALIDMETRLSAYTDSVGGPGGGTTSPAFTTSYTPNLATANKVFMGALTADTTINTPTSPGIGNTLSFYFLQDGTGGHTVAWSAAFVHKWVDGGNLPNKRASISFVYNGTVWLQEHYSPWISPSRESYGAHVTQTTNQSIPSGTATPHTFQSAVFDDGGFWSAGTASRVTAPVTGVYIVTASIYITAPGTTGQVLGDFFLNGTTVLDELDGGWQRTSGGDACMAGSAVWKATKADYVEVRTYQSTTVSKNATADCTIKLLAVL